MFRAADRKVTFPNTHTNATRFFAVSFCLVTTQLIVISLALTAFEKKKLCGWNLLPSKNFTITSNYFLDFPSFFLRSGIAMIFTLSFSREKLSTDTKKIPSKTFLGFLVHIWLRDLLLAAKLEKRKLSLAFIFLLCLSKVWKSSFSFLPF